jgi:ribosomal protein S6--L-glutamate ligase
MSAAGVRVPEAWVPGNLALLYPIVAERPLIIKPYQGRRNEGIVIVQNAAELAMLAPPSAPMLVQEYLRGYQEEIKVTVIGEHVFGVRLVRRADGMLTRCPCSISNDVRQVALKCGRVFGVGLYGMDVLVGEGGPVVIDLDYFPSYKGVPNAAPLIAEYILGYAQGNIPELTPCDVPAPAGDN